MRRGLVIGKFMPLHRGHELLIETALSECDEVTVLIYDSKVKLTHWPMPVEKRAGWVKTLFPTAKNVVVLPDPLADNEDRDHPRFAALYAAQIAFLGHFDRFYSGEPSYVEFGEIVADKSVLVDRATIPISGTQIRKNISLYRPYLSNVVYSSLIQKVVLVGTESTGKSTLAEKLAEKYSTLWAHEYGRELWESQGLTGTFEDYLKMATMQYAREEAMLPLCNGYLFCDTNPWTTLQWALMHQGAADVRLYDLVNRIKDEYIWILCDNSFDWVQDGTRELEGELSQRFQRQQIDALDKLKVKRHTVTGNPTERTVQVGYVLTQFERGS